jgi:hypothetical protein
MPQALAPEQSSPPPIQAINSTSPCPPQLQELQNQRQEPFQS